MSQIKSVREKRFYIALHKTDDELKIPAEKALEQIKIKEFCERQELLFFGFCQERKRASIASLGKPVEKNVAVCIIGSMQLVRSNLDGLISVTDFECENYNLFSSWFERNFGPATTEDELFLILSHFTATQEVVDALLLYQFACSKHAAYEGDLKETAVKEMLNKSIGFCRELSKDPCLEAAIIAEQKRNALEEKNQELEKTIPIVTALSNLFETDAELVVNKVCDAKDVIAEAKEKGLRVQAWDCRESCIGTHRVAFLLLKRGPIAKKRKQLDK